MINKFICTVIAASFTLGAYAQRSDATTKSLLKAEQEFTESAARNGVKSAYTSFSAGKALVFRPNPVNVKSYYATQPNDKNITFTPDFGRVSRSGDWGFVTGGYTVDGTEKAYGQYLSVWKTSAGGKWEMVLDINDSHNKPLHPVATKFEEPTDYYKPPLDGPKQVAAKREIILTTEKTMDAMLKSYGVGAFGGFLSANARVNFPGYEPIIGKDKIVAFYNSLVSKISFKTIQADRASGGDLAYTYGVATIDYRTDLRESFNYVFIYEREANHNWNLIQQIYTPAER